GREFSRQGSSARAQQVGRPRRPEKARRQPLQRTTTWRKVHGKKRSYTLERGSARERAGPARLSAEGRRQAARAAPRAPRGQERLPRGLPLRQLGRLRRP